MISDEAHHINAETKRDKGLNQSEMFDLTSWESTVKKIFNASKQNILLEFTATMDLTHEQVIEKYRDKIIDVIGITASFVETTHKIPLLSGYSQSSTLFELEAKPQANKTQKDYFIKSFGSSVIKKALAQFSQYLFSNLKRLFPNLKSLSEFVLSNHYLGKIKVEVEVADETVNSLTQESKLEIVTHLLDKLSCQLQGENVEHKGTKEFKPYMIKETFTDKKLNIVNDGEGNKESGIAQSETTNTALNMDLSSKDWLVFNEHYGTSEEKTSGQVS